MQVTTNPTERKSAEEERSLLAAIVEHSDDAIISKTLDGIILNWNPAAEKIYGYSAEEVIGQPISILVPPGQPDEVSQILDRIKWGEPVDHYETVRMRKDGQQIAVSLTISPIKDAAGNISGALTIARDVTERRRMEEALQKAHDELEQRVEEHTRELSTLLKVSYTVTSTLELEPLLDLILDQLKPVVDYTSISILTLEEEVTALAYRGPVPQEKALEFHFLAKSTWADQELFSRREPVIIADVRDDTPLTRTFRDKAGERLETPFAYIRSWMGVPLIVKERMVGILSLSHNKPNYYSPHQAELAFAFANQAAVAIENARLYSTTKHHADELETLFAVQQAITSRLDPDAVLQLIADEARRLTATRLSLVYLLDGNNLRIAVLSGEHSPDIFVGYRMPIAQSVAGLSIQSGQPVIVDDAQNDPRVYTDAIRRLGVRCYMTVPLMSVSQIMGVIAVADERAGILGPEDERVLAMLASGAVIGLENARLYQEEQARRHEAERRRKVAEGLRDILAILNSNRPLAEILDYIVTQAGRLLGSDTVAIYQLQIEAGLLSIQADRGLPADFVAEADVPVDQGALGQAVLTRQPVAVSDMAAALAEDGDLQLDPQRQALAARLANSYRALLVVPLIIKDEVYGDILLCYPEPRVFSDDEIRLAVTFCDQAALAIENARLRARVQQTAVDAERSRLARDLHDAVTQTLFSASLIAEVLPRLWDRNQAEGKRRLEELRQLTRGALAEMRTLLLELRPAALTEARVGELLRHLAEAITGRARTPVTLEVEGDCTLPPDVQVALYRITQEALNNVAKHAKANQAVVNLRCQSEQVELHIEDDGCGFELGNVSPEHLGLGIMHERAETIGATLKLQSRPAQGTQIDVVWPVPQ
jgi:PAS domain S-box-containing protein